MALSLLLCQESQQPCYIPQQGHLRHTQHTDSSPLNSHKTIIEKRSRLETLPATKKGVALNNVSNCFTIEAWWRYQGRKDKWHYHVIKIGSVLQFKNNQTSSVVVVMILTVCFNDCGHQHQMVSNTTVWRRNRKSARIPSWLNVKFFYLCSTLSDHYKVTFLLICLYVHPIQSNSCSRYRKFHCFNTFQARVIHLRFMLHCSCVTILPSTDHLWLTVSKLLRILTNTSFPLVKNPT